MAQQLDPGVERLLEGFVREVQGLYGEALVAVVLYGSAAYPLEYVPGRSDLNLLVLLKELTPDQLAQAFPMVKSWERQGIQPLFLDPERLQALSALYPLEFLEMQAQHRLLWGEDPLLALPIAQDHLAVQCAQELAGKLLQLYQGYWSSQGRLRTLEPLLLGSLRALGAPLRGLLRLRGRTPPREFLETLNELEREFGLPLEALRTLHQVRQGYRQLERDAAEPLLRQHLEELEALAHRARTLMEAGIAPPEPAP